MKTAEIVQSLIGALIDQAADAAINAEKLVDAENKLIAQEYAQAHVDTRDKLIEELQSKNNRLNVLLYNLHQAGIAALGKLKINTPERTSLSLALGDAARTIDFPQKG